MKLSRLILITLLTLPAPSALADVKLSALFGDHAVLQRDRPLPVWGWADPGETVTVTLGAETATATAGPDHRWTVTLAPQPVSTLPLTLTVTGKNTITLHDILLGDVWLCGGQSNMEFILRGCEAPDDVQSADLPLIRHFGVVPNFAVTPQTNVTGAWQVCSPRAAGNFTAVGFYFARRLNRETGVPIGLLRSCVGGTGIELWMSQETLLGTPALASYAQQMRASLDRYQLDLADAIPALEQWTADARAARKDGRPLPLPPAWPDFPFGEKLMRPRCVTLHNGMIAPLVPMSFRGVIWYQGENNAGDRLYVDKVRAMVTDWRHWFKDPNLPFYYVQLAAYQKANDNPGRGDDWAIVRDQQLHSLAIPHTGMAVAIDVGNADDIHPKDKFDVGERLALWALANDYGKKLETSGPLFREMKVTGNKAALFFDHVGKGLMAGRKVGSAPAEEIKDGALHRFAIAGADKQWRWAEVRIEGDTLVCTSPDVPTPVAVRYAWSSNPDGANLYNRDGLPASPFSTGD